jgi:hypothetical protein
MGKKQTLGIIINSNRYFSYVMKLADASMDKGKQVRIHMLGSGCEFIKTDACTRLSRLCQMTLCALTEQQNAVKTFDLHHPGVAVVPPQALSLIIQDCHRYVVF